MHWKQEFHERGMEGLKLSYRGREGDLSERERQEIIDYFKTTEI
jgi:hypothetical protein